MEGHRVGGYCPECRRANWAVVNDGNPHLSSALLPPEGEEIRARSFICGWCHAPMSGAAFEVLPDKAEARRAIALGEAVLPANMFDPEPKRGKTYAEMQSRS